MKQAAPCVYPAGSPALVPGCCGGTARSQLELVIEHLVMWGRLAQGAQEHCLHLSSTPEQKEWTQDGAALGSYKSQPWGRVALGPGLLAEEECCTARDPLHQLGEFSSFLCVTIGLPVDMLPGVAENLSEGIYLLCE